MSKESIDAIHHDAMDPADVPAGLKKILKPGDFVKPAGVLPTNPELPLYRVIRGKKMPVHPLANIGIDPKLLSRGGKPVEIPKK